MSASDFIYLQAAGDVWELSPPCALETIALAHEYNSAAMLRKIAL